MQTPAPTSPRASRKQTAWRTLATLAVVAVLALGFWGYTQPGMTLNWETLARLCGF